jgi:hypothetical protein
LSSTNSRDDHIKESGQWNTVRRTSKIQPLNRQHISVPHLLPSCSDQCGEFMTNDPLNRAYLLPDSIATTGHDGLQGLHLSKYHVRVTDNPTLLYRLATKWLIAVTEKNPSEHPRERDSRNDIGHRISKLRR